MFASSRKRKHRPQAHPTKRDERQSGSDSLHALYIQAYEADIVPGSDAAQSLEVVEYTNSSNPLREQLIVIPKIGSALIRWGGDTNSISKSYRDGSDEDDMLLPLADQDTEIPIWVDRYVSLFSLPCSYKRCLWGSYIIQHHTAKVNFSFFSYFYHPQAQHFSFSCQIRCSSPT